MGLVKIEAIIKPFKLDKVKDALCEIGIRGLTTYEAQGFGRQKGKSELFRGAEYIVELLPKRKIEVIVDEENADAAFDTIRKYAYTGNVGDGIVVMTKVEKAVRVRTGEEL